MKKSNVATKANTTIHRGKMVYDLSTHRLFPSAKVAAKETGINYHTVAKICEGKQHKGNNLFYIESVADIAKVFDEHNRKAKEAAQAQAEVDKLTKELENATKHMNAVKRQLTKATKKANKLN